jgi:hypothetical protein
MSRPTGDASAPVPAGCNFFDAVVECMDYVNATENDSACSKQDAVDGMRARLSIMMSRVLAGATHGESHSICGWAVENNDSNNVPAPPPPPPPDDDVIPVDLGPI